MKKMVALAMTCAIMLSSGAVFANTTEPDVALTPEQEAVIAAFQEPRVVSEVSLDAQAGRYQTFSSNITKRGYLERGSFLAWSKDHVEWTYNSSRITSSQAWQESGFVFPNTVREEGITKRSSSTDTVHRYYAKKVIGAGVVTPWGDVNVYEQTVTDYINVDNRGNFTY